MVETSVQAQLRPLGWLWMLGLLFWKYLRLPKRLQTISVDKVLFQGLRERAPMAEGDHALWDESLGKVSVNQ